MFKVTWGCEISKVKFERVGKFFSIHGWYASHRYQDEW